MIQTALFIVSMTMFWKYYHAVDIMMARGRETALFSFYNMKVFVVDLI